MIKNINDLLKLVVKTNTMIAITGDAQSGKTTMAETLVSFLPDEYKINVIGKDLGAKICADYSKKNVTVKSLNILDDNSEQLMELAADATIIDEVVEADDFGSIINIGLQDDCGLVVFVHPANNTENLFKSFRKCLIKACGFADEASTDKYILEALKLNIHMVKEDGKVFVESFSELVAKEDGTHTVHNIATFDKATDSYKIEKMSDSLYKGLCDKLSAADKAELDKMF